MRKLQALFKPHFILEYKVLDLYKGSDRVLTSGIVFGRRF